MAHPERLEPYQPQQIIDTIVEEIDLYWDHALESPKKTLTITETDTNETYSQHFTIKRIHDTAYYLKYISSRTQRLGGNLPLLAEPTNITEFRFTPDLFEAGQVNITQTDPASNTTVCADYLIDQLKQENPEALRVLDNLQAYLIYLLIICCQNLPLFHPLPPLVHQLALDTYGPIVGEGLWRDGIQN